MIPLLYVTEIAFQECRILFTTVSAMGLTGSKQMRANLDVEDNIEHTSSLVKNLKATTKETVGF